LQANSKVQIVLKKIRAEVKCIKKNLAEKWDGKKIRAAKILYPPLPGFLMVRPLEMLYVAHSEFTWLVHR
jgi:hypothetical protein